MKELLYLEVPTPEIGQVRSWLQTQFSPTRGEIHPTPDGFRLHFGAKGTTASPLPACLSVVTWSLQRTTYLKVFRWAESALPQEAQLLQQLEQAIRTAFPPQYPQLPPFDPSQESIFEALKPAFPKTVTYFQRMPNGQADLERVYWWEKRWCDHVRHPQTPKQIIFQMGEATPPKPEPLPPVTDGFDLIYIGGALGVIHAAVMAQLGYKVLLIERLPFGRMNREWNISRAEFQGLIDLGLLSEAEFESLIAREYEDGFNKFFDANNPAIAKAPVLHTPTVLNIAMDSEALLKCCGQKLRKAGGTIWDETEFDWAEVSETGVTVYGQRRYTQEAVIAQGRLLVDAMGTASPIAWQLNGGRAFDSVCPTVGACISGGFEPAVWDATYGDVLFSHGDISRGRQLIWELFPGKDDELTVYLFHYHQVNDQNPGSLLTMYEDFFHILPEYRRCNLNQLTWRKPTFGYIPGHFSVSRDDRQVAVDRLVAIGDAASLQSPLVFTGFGSLIRNLPRLTELLHVALTHDLLKARHLNQVRAFQSNVAVTWLFSKGMMVPTGAAIAPARINSMLNTFFGILASESPAVAERFIKDQATWAEFNRMALTAATRNPAMLIWIFELAGFQDLCRWGLTYLNYTLQTFLSWFLSWLTTWLPRNRSWLEPLSPSLFLQLLALNYHFTYGMGQPPAASPVQIQTLDTLASTPPPVPDRPNAGKPKSAKVPTA